METHLTVMERHLPYMITVSPATDTDERAPPEP